jgi:hypothetical protein
MPNKSNVSYFLQRIINPLLYPIEPRERPLQTLGFLRLNFLKLPRCIAPFDRGRFFRGCPLKGRNPIKSHSAWAYGQAFGHWRDFYRDFHEDFYGHFHPSKS